MPASALAADAVLAAAAAEANKLATIKQPIEFEITPDSLSAAANISSSSRRLELVPNLILRGRLDSSIWSLNEPITGEFVIEHCSAVIRSVELQLVRVETTYAVGAEANLISRSSSSSSEPTYLYDCSEDSEAVPSNRDATEVQNIQIGYGDLMRNVPISIHMVLPRLFTCPTLVTNHFKIGRYAPLGSISDP